MAIPILATKLYLPPHHPNAVVRSRLLDRLDAGCARGCRLTLVSAPAGYGKTTLVSDWLRRTEQGIVWLSLDEQDNDPTRFFAHFIAGFQQVVPTIGQDTTDLLAGAPFPSLDAVMTRLVNDLVHISQPLTVVLDDYHVLQASPIHSAIQFLLAHQPPSLHLIVITRQDPPLSLPRLRARGAMTEIRADDLRFTTEEAITFFRQTMRLDLMTAAVTALNTRAEGWAASLQLAAFALQGDPGRTASSVERFVAAFGGSHRYVMDYLMDEVLAQLPEDWRTFLYQTAILDRLTGSLCESVTNQTDCQATLEKMDRANLFVIPLDEARSWYRYHHLFADLLRYRLRQLQPDRIPELHRRAATWYAQHSFINEAIQHWLAAHDFEQAARVVEQHAELVQWQRGEWETVRGWLDQLPDELIHAHPKLCLACARGRVLAGQITQVEPYLHSVETYVQQTESHAVDQFAIRRLQCEVAIVRANIAWQRGDLSDANHLFHRALELLPSEEQQLQTRIRLGLAETNYLIGDVGAASQAYQALRELSSETRSFYAALIAMSRLCMLAMLQGRLHQAHQICQQMQQFIAAQSEPLSAIASMADGCFGDLLREWNELDRAAQHLQKSIECGQRIGNPLVLLHGHIGLARVLQAQGDMTGAHEALTAAKQIEQQHRITWTRGTPAASTWQARLDLAQGNVAMAARWAQEQKLSATDELSFHREVEHLTLARLLIAQDQTTEALHLLDRLASVTESSGRLGRLLEVRILQALAWFKPRDTHRAFECLSQAMTMAEPAGYVRIFLDEGEPMIFLISDFRFSIEKQSALHHLLSYVDKLLATFATPSTPSAICNLQFAILPDPLSARELEVLRMMASGWSNQQIAQTLCVTLGTVKSHNNHIFRKLDVTSRTQAIVKAQALGLL